MIRAVLVALCLATASAAAVMAEGKPDPVVGFDRDDPAMTAAVAAARKSLPAFLEAMLDAQGYGPDGGYLKVGFAVEDPAIGVENIWVGPFRRLGNNRFVGLLANEPQAMPGLHNGDRVEFTQKMIVDWNLAAGDGRFWGDYTTRVVVSRLPADQARPLRKRFIEPPVPAAWPRR